MQQNLFTGAQPYNLIIYIIRKALTIMNLIDLNRLAFKSSSFVPGAEEKQMPPKHGKGEKFLKGPIPWTWLSKAAQQSGKALHVAIIIWFLAGINKSRTIKLSNKILREFGVKRHSGYRGLKALESVQLISVKRHRGRNSIVTILEHK